jgi:hypothetical protein
VTDENQSPFEKNAPDLFNALEATMKALKDKDYSAAVVDKGIAEAKSLLEAGKAAEAEQKYTETKLLVERAEASILAEPLAWRLLFIQLGYLVLLLFLGYVTHQWPAYWLWSGFLTLHSATAWFGALGGVAIGLYGLYTHIQARDFDPKFELWYVCKPVMGAIFGWFVFLVYFVGFIAVQGNAKVENRLVLYAIAFLAGFSERFTIKIIDRLMQVLTTWEEKPGNSPDIPSSNK